MLDMKEMRREESFSFKKNYNAIRAVAHDIPVIGYGNKMVNALRIWDAQPLQPFELASFDRGIISKRLSKKN